MSPASPLAMAPPVVLAEAPEEEVPVAAEGAPVAAGLAMAPAVLLAEAPEEEVPAAAEGAPVAAGLLGGCAALANGGRGSARTLSKRNL